MDKHIIIEGFWNMGKSTLVDKFAADSYTVIKEPDHLKEDIGVTSAHDWYIDEHLKNQSKFESASTHNEAVMMERSLLSSAAYIYAIDGKQEDGVISKFKLMWGTIHPLVVFLYAKRNTVSRGLSIVADKSVSAHSEEVSFIDKYDDFFRNVLPFKYDINCLCINIEKDDGTQKTTDEIKANIAAACDNDRYAQVNVAAFKETVNGNTLYLVLKRNEKKGGFWQTMSGGVKGIHTVRQTALIELSEELGIDTHDERLIDTGYSFNYIGGEGYELNDYAFGYKLEENEKITLSDEHVDSAFLPLEDAKKLLKYESNKNIIDIVSKTK